MEDINSIEDVSLEDFVKVEENEGPMKDRLIFSGQILRINSDMVEVLTPDGIFGLPIHKELFNATWKKMKNKPRGWGKFIKNPSKKEKTVKVNKTKKELIFDLVKKNPRKQIPGLLKLAKKEIGGDESLLSNYIQLAILKIK